MGLRGLCRAGAAVAIATGAMLAMAHAGPGISRAAAEVRTDPPKDGEMGFVVSGISWALGPDAASSGSCPAGMSMTADEAFRASVAGRRRDGETDLDYAARVREAIADPPGIPHACASPRERGPDPLFKVVSGRNVEVPGIDLDGVDSRSLGRPSPGTCVHDDFAGEDGGRGIDNQLYRLVGCGKGFQSNGTHITFAREMLTGSWGIVIALRGVDDLENDPSVDVEIHANADPIQLTGKREAIAYASYAIDPDPRFQARTRGRIVDGVLTSDPVNARFRWVVNNIRLERPLDQAQLRLRFTKDGGIEGIMAGYTNVDELYDLLHGLRNGKDGAGNPAAQRTILTSSAGSAGSAGYSCNGIYHAMHKLADAGRDPATGQCNALSTQYRIRAVPAFVVPVLASTGPARTG